MSTPRSGLGLLVTGARGQVGSEVVRGAGRAGIAVFALGSAELDITDARAVRSAVTDFARDCGTGRGVVINAAAYTAVDAAETDRDAAFELNGTAPGLLARAAADCGVGLIHLSTDYVFSGNATRPYEVDDPVGPRTVYGASKLAGERAVLEAHPGAQVVRTAWVYGPTGPNFLTTMTALERSRATISVVDDQTGSPTRAADLAAGLIELASSDVAGGVLHATGGGHTTWFDFARAVFVELGADPGRVLPVTTRAFPRPAPRPAYSVLSNRAWIAAGLGPLPGWRQALMRSFGELGPGPAGSAPVS